MPAEVVLIGGAAILERYGFRDTTYDVDAIIHASSAMKDAINQVGERYHLPRGWLNTDFTRTDSFSGKLVQYAVFYKTFNRILTVRIVTGEYLIAMKLRAFRYYKIDVSDIVGILAAHERDGDGITWERIDQAVRALYGSWDDFDPDAVRFIREALSEGRYDEVFDLVRQNEAEARDTLLAFREEYPGVLKGENANDILRKLRKRKKNE